MADDGGFYDNANLCASFDGDYVNFTWKKIEGSKHYIFMLRHVHNKEHIIIRKIFSQNSHRYKTDVDVQYGQRYEMRVQFVWSDEAVSNTKWQEFVLGGPTVPSFPNVRLNQENPQRSVVIEWEKPELDPIGYQVTSIPLYGRRKTYTSCECTITIFKLKSNTVYNFGLQALFDESTGIKESPRCKTCSIKTHSKPGTTLATQTYDNIQGSTFHIKNPTSVHNSQVMKFNPSNFGKVENVEMITRSDDELEMAYIQWEDPYFLGERDDYQIKQYEVRIKQGSNTMFRWTIQNKLRTEEFMINRGECYEIHIGTRYEEIDTEKPNYVALKEYFYSRPATPKIAIIEELNSVKVKWSGAKGAVEYRLEIFDANSTTPIVTEEKGKSFTNLTISKEEFYLGRYYNFVVTAYGKEKGKSHVKKEILLGGELVPRNARAVVNPHQPSNSIDIEWESPDKRPVSYEVKEVGCPNNVIETKETRCTIKGLRTGITYKFEVSAKHDEETISCASVTNDVKTDPRPGRIAEAQRQLCDRRPDKSIKLEWKPCLGATIYRIRASCEDTVREHYVRENKYHLDELSPNTLYEINLSAGNDNGFGEENKITISTEMEVPVHVILSYDAANGALVGECGGRSHEISSLWNLYKSHGDILIESKISNGLACQFDAFEGNTKYYATVQFVCEEMKSLQVSSNTLLSVPSQVTITKVSVSEDEPTTDFYIIWEEHEGLIYQIKIDTDYKTERIVQSTNVGECHCRCLREGNEYLVEIRAANDTGFGKWSRKEYIQLERPSVRGLTAVNVDDSVIIKWEQPRSRLFSSSTFYQVKIFENGHAIANEKVKETSFRFKNVKPTKKYDFSVVAVYDNDVCSQRESGFITVEMGAPINVTLGYDAEKDSLIAACGGRRSETSSTAWNLYKRHGDILVDSKRSYDLSCQFDSYENDTEYFVTVQFVCEEIKSVCVPSNTLLTVPSQVSISSVHVSEVEPATDIHITWEPKEELTYEIKIITDHKTERIIRSEKGGECFYRCLYEGNEYYVAMRATNSTGFGKWSKKYSVLLEPPKVRELTAVKVRDGINIRWKEPKNNHLSRAILFYLVEIRQSELSNEPLVQTKVKHAFFTFQNVAPMKKYDFSVSAVYDNNIQSKFESGSITIEGLLPPKSARAVVDRHDPVCVHLCWFNGDDIAPGSRYLIIFNDKILTSSYTDCTLRDLKPDTEYLVEIYSMNEGITSDSPAVVNFKTGKLASVEFGAHEFDTDQPWRFVTLRWHRSPGADKSLIRTNQEGDRYITTKKEFIKLERTSSDRELNVKITPIARGVSGKLDTTVNITMPEIPSAVPGYLKVKLCEEFPWQYADIEWERPRGLKWSKVAISPLSSTRNFIGLNAFERTFQGSFLRFERNCRKSSYGVKIWTGYSRLAFCEDYLETKFIMGPDMPEVEEARWESAKFFIVFEEADLAIEKLILTVCKDSQVVKTQEVDWPVPRSTVEITGLPERNYDFYMETVWRSYRRPKKIIEPHSRPK